MLPLSAVQRVSSPIDGGECNAVEAIFLSFYRAHCVFDDDFNAPRGLETR